MGINRSVDRRRNLQLGKNSSRGKTQMKSRMLTGSLLLQLKVEVFRLQNPGVLRPSRSPSAPAPLQ